MNQEIEIKTGQTRQTIEVMDPIAVLDTGRFEQMQRIASIMARSSLTPEHLRTVAVTDDEGNPVYENGKQLREHLSYEAVFANCFRIVNQAIRWGLDPFPVAECTSVVRGRLCYEGKLVAGVLDAKLGIELAYEWNDKTGPAFGVVVSGRTQKRGDLKSVSGTVAEWATERKGSPWKFPGNHRRMLAYRGTREWARLYKPALMLGIYTEDEMDEIRGRSIAPVQHALGKPAAAPMFTSLHHGEPWRPENDAAANGQPALTDDDLKRATVDYSKGVPLPSSHRTHGRPELDADAAKLEAMGQDAGPTMAELERLARDEADRKFLNGEAGPVDENPTQGSSAAPISAPEPSPSTSASPQTAPSGESSAVESPTAEATSSTPSPTKESSTAASTATTAPAATTAPPEPTDATQAGPTPVDDITYQAHCVAWVATAEDRKDALAQWAAERALRRKLNLTAETVEACKLLVERAFPKEG